MFSNFADKFQKNFNAVSNAAKQKADEAKKQFGNVSRGASGSTAGGPTATSVMVDPDGVKQLVAMGFREEQAYQALAEVGGDDVEAAAAFLCGEAGMPGGAAFGAGSWVEVTGWTDGPGPSIEGQRGRVVKFDQQKDRYLVELGGTHKFLVKAEHLIPASAPEGGTIGGTRGGTIAPPPPPSSSSSSTAMMDKAKNSVQQMRQKAEAMLKQSSPKNQSGKSAPFEDPRLLQNSESLTPEERLRQRRAVAEAAQKRLEGTRARNAGTMEEWRRAQRERQMGSGLAQAQRGGSGGRGEGGPTFQRRQDPGPAPTTRELAQARMAREAQAGDDSQIESEEMQLQRALEASMLDVDPHARWEAAAAPAAISPKQAAPPTPVSPPRAAAAATESEQGSPLSAGGAAAEEEEGEEWEEDPELFELQLQQAMAEEEMELQQALALSIEAERQALEEARSKDVASPTADVEEADTPFLKEAATEESDPVDITASEQDLARLRSMEEKLKEEQEAIKERVEDLRTQVAERAAESPVKGASDSPTKGGSGFAAAEVTPGLAVASAIAAAAEEAAPDEKATPPEAAADDKAAPEAEAEKPAEDCASAEPPAPVASEEAVAAVAEPEGEEATRVEAAAAPSVAEAKETASEEEKKEPEDEEEKEEPAAAAEAVAAETKADDPPEPVCEAPTEGEALAAEAAREESPSKDKSSPAAEGASTEASATQEQPSATPFAPPARTGGENPATSEAEPAASLAPEQ